MRSSFFKSVHSFGLILGIQTYFILKFKKREKVHIPKSDIHFKVRPGSPDYLVIKQIFIRGELDFNYSEYLNNPSVIIDCGAHIGISTMYFATHFPNATVFSIEANSFNFRYLNLNTHSCNSVVTINKAVWFKNELLNVNDPGIGNWGYMVSHNDINKVETVEAITLDDLIVSRKINNIDILKMDIEGAEREIFEKGKNNWLSITRLIVIEFHDRIKDGTKSIVEEKLFQNDFRYEMQIGENSYYSNSLISRETKS